jgi:hypothetical protein
MKSSKILILVNLFCITMLQSQISRDLDFRIVSSGTGYGIQSSQFIIELQMKSNDGIAELGAGQLTITFNSDAMTLNTDDSYVNQDIENYNPLGIGNSYNSVHVYSPATGYVQTGLNLIYTNAVFAYDIPTTWINFSHIVFDITDTAQSTEIEWDTFEDANSFTAEDNTTLHVVSTLEGEIDTPLPVMLTSFTAEMLYGLCQLYWTTQSEVNNLGWNVYRSPSQNIGQAHKLTISLIEGAGTTSQPTDYHFTDTEQIEAETRYWYWLESLDYSGNTIVNGPIELAVQLAENPNPPDIPKKYGLFQNYPNPFNPSTEISFFMKQAGRCELEIYNLKGRKVKTLFSGNIEAEQDYCFTWNGKNESEKLVVSGVYFYKLKYGSTTEIKKMILLK